MKNIVIIGATSAIAEAVARKYAEEGSNLYLTGRNKERLEVISEDLKIRGATSVESYLLDITSVEQQTKFVNVSLSHASKIDVVLIAPGTLPNQTECENDISMLRAELDINGVSIITLLQLLAAKLVTQQDGVLAVISSPAGDRGRQSNFAYGAAKGAVSIFAQGLRNKLSQKNVCVLTIKPGFVDTPMTSAFDKSGPLWVKPEKVAIDIVKGIAKRKDVIYTPWFWYFIMLVIKLIPEKLFKRLSL